MSDQIVQVNFRMPAALKERLEGAAAENKRSLTAEVVERLEGSFSDPSEALVEAAKVAESLRANLTERIKSYHRMSEKLEQQEKSFEERSDKSMKRLRDREAKLRQRENELFQREQDFRQELNQEYDKRVKKHEERLTAAIERAEERWKRADEYAGFTIARERQFIETIKALTGKEPPAVEPARPARFVDDAGTNDG